MAEGSAGSDDELAHTATAPGGKPAPVTPLAGDQLGRFRLERELGAGGMGVVHAAFDPDLERRVALKVLRAVDNSEARERLLREARATARVEHANVVVVFEVGSASGRDYIAMELVEGETLAKWLEQERSDHEVVQAFVAAGRGLAAAHGKDLVHRDFKPNNVLVRRDGRIVVTDFGLARGIERGEQLALGETLPIGAHTSSSLSDGITRTGALLGTPAYMAPEQWTGGTVGPAADQFAFCVALWEALTGERPFGGTTLEELKASVQRGADPARASKLPRRLRKPLLRGLAVDPAKRWPTMDALLAAITRAERRPRVAIALAAGAAILLASIGYETFAAHGGAAAAKCEAPALEPQTVWSPAIEADFVGKGIGAVAQVFAEHAHKWELRRVAICRQSTPKRSVRLACLDGVQARLAAMRHAVEAEGVASADADITRELLVDPEVCDLDDPPTLAIRATPGVERALGFLADSAHHDHRFSDAEYKQAADAVAGEPCARGIAELALGNRTKDDRTMHTAIADALTAGDNCRDDRLMAELRLFDVPAEWETPLGPRGMAAFEKAKSAIERVKQPDLVGHLEMMQSDAAMEQKNYAAAIKSAEAALTHYLERGDRRWQVRAVAQASTARLYSARPEDLQSVVADTAKWRPIADAVGSPELVRGLDRLHAEASFALGDVKGAHSALYGSFRSDNEDKETPKMPKRPVAGVVVDAAGKPVPGATVFAGFYVELDSEGPRVRAPSDRFVTTDGNGAFTLPDAIGDCTIVAAKDTRRSVGIPCAEHVKLVLVATRRVEGNVALGGLAHTQGEVIVRPITQGRTALVAPIKPDGTFSLDGIPVDKVQIGYTQMGTSAEHFETLPAGSGVATGVHIEAVQKTRPLDVVARSTVDLPLDVAQVMVVPGHKTYTTFADMFLDLHMDGMQVELGHHVTGEPPPAVANLVRPGDLITHLTVPEGDVSVCVVGLHGNVRDTLALIKINMHLHELRVACVLARPSDKAVVVEAPPQKRFD
jgi:hypothetical protein